MGLQIAKPILDIAESTGRLSGSQRPAWERWWRASSRMWLVTGPSHLVEPRSSGDSIGWRNSLFRRLHD
jgi:hypothetical protein